KDLNTAEDVLVAQGKVDEAIAMRHNFQQYEEALSLAKKYHIPDEDFEDMTSRYFKLLLDTKQEERAAILKEKEVC
ncbi:unnamed protein product, partial [Choristocarpus tenellus]